MQSKTGIPRILQMTLSMISPIRYAPFPSQPILPSRCPPRDDTYKGIGEKKRGPTPPHPPGVLFRTVRISQNPTTIPRLPLIRPKSDLHRHLRFLPRAGYFEPRKAVQGPQEPLDGPQSTSYIRQGSRGLGRG